MNAKITNKTMDELSALCVDIPAILLQEHIARLGGAYFQVFSSAQIHAHLRILARLNSQNPVEMIFERSPNGEVACTVLAFDYPAEFSMITGILSAMGFNIIAGDVFTYARAAATERQIVRPRRHATRSDAWLWQRRRIIDRFTGTIAHTLPEKEWIAQTTTHLRETIALLENGQTDCLAGARHKVNELVAKRLAELNTAALPVLYPVRLDVENRADLTRLRVLAQDTPAFLYSLSAALALQGVSIERVRIRTTAGQVEDEMDVLGAEGRPLTEGAGLDRIRLAVLLTKQFTYFVGHAPDPYSALCRFERMVESILKLPERGQWVEMLSNPRTMRDLARLLGASDFIWEDFVRLQYETLLPMLQPHVTGHRFAAAAAEIAHELTAMLNQAGSFEAKCRLLNEFKDRQLFLLDLDHILTPSFDVRAFAEALTALAENVLRVAATLVYEHLKERFGVPRTVAGLEGQWALFGLGKFGGVAMGYASDIELLFVYSDGGQTDGAEPLGNAEFYDRFVRLLAESITAKREGVFHVDTRLRPYGQSGPLACSLESFCRYYGGGGAAQAYERLALARLRAVGGNAALGAQVERLRDEFVYANRKLDLQALRELRMRQLAEKAQAGQYNAKFSPGALVDLEYDVQILQVTHGYRAPKLRTPRIHEALGALSELGILAEAESRRLTDAYYFLRRLINGLRLLRGSARDLFLPPADTGEFAHLARRMGYQRGGELESEQQLRVDFETHTAAVRAFVERHFGRDALPGPAMGNVADLVLADAVPVELREQILKRFAFGDTNRAYLNLRQLSGEGERQDCFARLAVLACDSLRQAADPDMALNNWERFARVLRDVTAHYRLLLNQPRRLEILLGIFSGSQFLAETLIQNPEFLDWVTDPEVLHAARGTAMIAKDLNAFAAPILPRAEWLNALRRFRQREILRIGARDICLQAPIEDITANLSSLAEALIQCALNRVWLEQPRRPDAEAQQFCILAFGKLGGAELNYSSDIDLLGLCADPEQEGVRATEFYARVLRQVGNDLSAHTDCGHAYRVDFRLRPYGGAGQLVQTVSGLAAYYERKAAFWEIQALLKARVVAGAESVGAMFLKRARPILLKPRPATEIMHTVEKLRVAARRAAKNGDHDVKSGLGGIRDIEFLAQALQLAHAHRYPALIEANTIKTLELLQRHAILQSDVTEALRSDYVWLRRLEHYLQIFEDRQIHALPETTEEQTALARRIFGPQGTAGRLLAELDACQQRVGRTYAHYVTEKQAENHPGE